MHDIQKELSESKRLIATGRQLLNEFNELLRQSQKIIQQSQSHQTEPISPHSPAQTPAHPRA